MIRILRLLFFALVSILIFNSCNQSPPTAPQPLIPNEDLIHATHVTSDTWNLPQSSSNYDIKLVMGVADRLLLGRNEYSNTDMLLRFNIYLPDTMIAFLRSGEASIAKAWLEMIPSYMLGDSTKPFGFTAYQVRTPWGLLDFDKDSLQTVLQNKDQNNVLSNFNVQNPTLKDSVIFNIAPSVVKEWLIYDSTDANSKKNYGLVFVPTPETDRYLGFTATTTASTADTTFLKVVLHKNNWYADDTVKVTPYMDTHVTTNRITVPVNNNEIYLEGSFAERGFLRFDLSKVPSNIILNKVILSLESDPQKSFSAAPPTDSIGITILADSVKKSYTSDSTITTLLKRNGNTFTGNVSWMIQKWIEKNNATPNQGMMLFIINDASTAERLVFFGSGYPDKSKRPKLDIYYTQKN